MLGFAASMLSYLLAERALRHERAAALDGGWLPPGPGAMGMRTRLLLAWLGAAALPLLAIAMFFVNSTAEQRANSAWVVWLTVVIGTVAGFLVTLFASRTIIEPIHTIRRGMQAVAQGHLDHEIDVDDASELGLLQSGFNQMVDGLKERERMREIFGHHVGTDVAARALAGITGLGGERRHATAMFVDIIGSTALTHRNDADDVVAILNAFFDTIVRAIGTHGGMVNKFQGDGALCVFGVPHEQPDHAVRALRAARTLHADLRLMRVEAAIGVSSGEVVAGNVGTADRYEYTVIGDAVNEASRLCDVAKTSSVRVLASSATITLSGESSAWYEVGRYNLRGRSAETIAYSLT